MACATWNPNRQLNALRGEIDRMFEGYGLERWTFPFSRFSFLPGRAARAYPLLNLSEDADHYYLEGLAPGLDTTKLNVTVVGDKLTIEGEKANPGKDVKAEGWHRNERSAGRFVRTLTLPGEVEHEQVKAQYANGLLAITLPKAEASKPRQIAVNVA